jgi:acyl-CoA synthetase (AMP-forming)/AMP-acid ligase II
MIFRSPYPDAIIPEAPLPSFVLQRAQQLADKPALIDGPSGRTLTYRQLADQVQRVAAGLTQRGLQKGDVFAIYSPNLPEYAVAFHAVASLGGILTTANPLATADELAYQLNDAGARYLLTIPQLLDAARAAAGRAQIREIFVFGEAEGATPFAALLASEGDAPAVAIDPREDLLALPYSSGTTGYPKGVMISHYNMVANICQCEALSAQDYTADDTIIAVLPFYHIYGMTCLMNLPFRIGATVVTMPRFDMEQFLQIMQDYRVTFAYVMPPIVVALAKHPVVDKYDLSRLRGINSGAAPLGEPIAQACAERLGCLVKQGYGLTEASPVTHTNLLIREQIKIASIGPCIPNTECMVVDVDTGAALGPNQQGEIWIRGPQVMRGYLNRPEATAAMLDAAGWLHTGDIGSVDDDGYFFVVDRLKELIKYNAYQVAPAELEALLLGHPAVADAAVVGRPDEAAGELPTAYIVAREAVSAEEIMAYIAERVAPHKKIRAVEFTDQIPKAASGKLLRRVLVERERARAAGA